MQYTLKNKIKTITLGNICIIKHSFINNKFAKVIFPKFKIEIWLLVKLKLKKKLIIKLLS